MVQQLKLPESVSGASPRLNRSQTNPNALLPEDAPFHNWYRFVLSFPPHLVRQYLDKFEATSADTVLDPFCGTGTTLVEAKKSGFHSIGSEAIPLAAFAASTKTDWAVDGAALEQAADSILGEARSREAGQGGNGNGAAKHKLKSLSIESSKLLLKDSISPLPLHKCLLLRELIDERADSQVKKHLRLALASAAVKEASNLCFGPEVGLGAIRHDADVYSAWRARVHAMARDLSSAADRYETPCQVFEADARTMDLPLPPESVTIVITSPPYPNEKDYTRTVRLESVLLGLIGDRAGLRETKQHLLRSNTRGVYKDDADDLLIADVTEINELAEAIEQRRIELGKTSGFERLYARVTRLYFGGMKRHLLSLIPFLKPGARLAYVVGDQASYLRIHIKTGQLLAQIAESVGFVVNSIDLFRTRRATATKAELREEVVVMTWAGERHG